ncbi:MAG TPA: hypothetical protein DCO86_04065 [Spirochaetaceae bacterium]|nr:hypothetical protein [Spirochaetaceae bacterium]
MACAMIYWGDKPLNFHSVFQEHGAVLDLRELKESKRQNDSENLLFSLDCHVVDDDDLKSL